jgi:hypothetical protein
MAVYEALLLNTVVPQIQAAQTGDSYVMVVNATTPALRITQTGTGNAISVEDEANPDATPFVVTAAGDVGIGTSSPTTKLHVSQSNAGNYASVILLSNSADAAADRTGIYGSAPPGNALPYRGGITFWPGAAGKMTFHTGNNAAPGDGQVMELSTSGNLGLGVTPSAWDAAGAGGPVLQIQRALLFGANTETRLIHNAYYGTGDFRYIASSVAATNYQQASGQHRWFNAPSGTAGDAISFTQAMTLDASGNLGVGVTSVGAKIQAETNASSGDVAVIAASKTGLGYTTTLGYYASAGTATAGVVRSANSLPLALEAGATERARITSGGNLLVGTQTDSGARCTIDAASATNAVNIALPSYDYFGISIHNKATSNDNSFIAFGTEASFTARGSITYNRAGGLVAYNTTSDYRAKDVTGPVANSGATIDALKVYNGKMKGATVERPMLIAHEAQEVTPYAVTGEKDAVDEDGKPKYQQMDVSSLVPLLIAELQSLRARVAQLEAK